MTRRKSKKIPSLYPLLVDWFFQDQALITKLFVNGPFFSKFELFLRIIIEVILLSFFVSLTFFWGLLNIVTLFIIVGIVHSLNHFFNGPGYRYLFALMKKKLSDEERINFVSALGCRLKSRGMTALIYGGVARGEYDQYSDIDVYVINIGNPLQKLINCFCNTIERIRSFWRGIPLDIWSVEEISYLNWRVHNKGKEKSFIIISDPKNLAGKLGVPLETLE